MFSPEELGKALRLLRARRDMTQGEVAARTTITKAMLSSYELGLKLPSFESLAAVLNALGEDFHDLQEALTEVRNGRPVSTAVKPECLGQALRLLRIQRNLTQSAVANEAKITKAMLSYYETGRQLPSLQSLAAVLKGLKCDLYRLQEALLLVLPEGERPQKVPRIRHPAKLMESVPESVGSPEAGGLSFGPEEGGQALIAALESLGKEGPTVRAILWIERTPLGSPSQGNST